MFVYSTRRRRNGGGWMSAIIGGKFHSEKLLALLMLLVSLLPNLHIGIINVVSESPSKLLALPVKRNINLHIFQGSG